MNAEDETRQEAHIMEYDGGSTREQARPRCHIIATDLLPPNKIWQDVP